ncbi:MAG: Xaa-Pro peptidase family protein [Burkholderiaceae bacterium]
MAILSHAVRDYRWAKTRALMDAMQVDAFIFTGADFFQFITNFHTDVQTWERPIFAILPRDGTPLLIMNELSMHHVRYSLEGGKLWSEDIEFWSEHPRLTDRLPLPSQLPEMLADRLRRAGLTRSRIAIEGGNSALTRAMALLPEARAVPATAEARSLRWQKHAEELDAMLSLAQIADWLQDRYRENIRPGRLVQELDFAMAALWVEEAARRFPGEHFEVIRTWTLSGPASASPHGDGRSCGARIERGHGLVNIVIPRLNGVAIENERTFFCGKPSADQARYWSVARDANQAAIEAAVSGNPVSAIDAASAEVIERAGLGAHIRHRAGHAIGVIHHEYPEDMAFNARALLDNEVYSAEPGVYVWGVGGFRLDDTVVVGPSPRVLTQTPKTLEYATVD